MKTSNLDTYHYNEAIQYLWNCKRICIVGNQGAGKTTLAKTLQNIMNINHVSFEWRQLSTVEIEELHQQMRHLEYWIVDGDFGLMPWADIVLYLNYPLWLCMWRDIRRRFGHLQRWNFSDITVWLQLPKKIIKRFKFFFEIPWNPLAASCQIKQFREDELSQDTEIREESNVSSENQGNITKFTLSFESPKELELFLDLLKNSKITSL